MAREKEIPLKIEVFTDGSESDYLIHSRKEIQSILKTIAQRKTRSALYFDEGHRFILTLVLAVDEEGLWIDDAPSELDRRHILNSKHLVFVSTHNQTKVQFVSATVTEVIFEGHPALYLPLPGKLLRLQRRDYFRLSTPEPNALKCTLRPIPEKAHLTHDVTIMDISIGGVGLVCEEHEIELVPGSVYPDCQIELPGVGTLTASLQVKNTFEITERNGKVRRRAGCVFVKPDGKTTMLLQRYVALMQQQAAANRLT